MSESVLCWPVLVGPSEALRGGLRSFALLRFEEVCPACRGAVRTATCPTCTGTAQILGVAGLSAVIPAGALSSGGFPGLEIPRQGHFDWQARSFGTLRLRVWPRAEPELVSESARERVFLSIDWPDLVLTLEVLDTSGDDPIVPTVPGWDAVLPRVPRDAPSGDYARIPGGGLPLLTHPDELPGVHALPRGDLVLRVGSADSLSLAPARPLDSVDPQIGEAVRSAMGILDAGRPAEAVEALAPWEGRAGDVPEFARACALAHARADDGPRGARVARRALRLAPRDAESLAVGALAALRNDQPLLAFCRLALACEGVCASGRTRFAWGLLHEVREDIVISAFTPDGREPAHVIRAAAAGLHCLLDTSRGGTAPRVDVFGAERAYAEPPARTGGRLWYHTRWAVLGGLARVCREPSSAGWSVAAMVDALVQHGEADADGARGVEEESLHFLPVTGRLDYVRYWGAARRVRGPEAHALGVWGAVGHQGDGAAPLLALWLVDYVAAHAGRLLATGLSSGALPGLAAARAALAARAAGRDGGPAAELVADGLRRLRASLCGELGAAPASGTGVVAERLGAGRSIVAAAAAGALGAEDPDLPTFHAALQAALDPSGTALALMGAVAGTLWYWCGDDSAHALAALTTPLPDLTGGAGGPGDHLARDQLLTLLEWDELILFRVAQGLESMLGDLGSGGGAGVRAALQAVDRGHSRICVALANVCKWRGEVEADPFGSPQARWWLQRGIQYADSALLTQARLLHDGAGEPAVAALAAEALAAAAERVERCAADAASARHEGLRRFAEATTHAAMEGVIPYDTVFRVWPWEGASDIAARLAPEYPHLFENAEPMTAEFLVDMSPGWFWLTSYRLLLRDVQGGHVQLVPLNLVRSYRVTPDAVTTSTISLALADGRTMNFNDMPARRCPSQDLIQYLLGLRLWDDLPTVESRALAVGGRVPATVRQAIPHASGIVGLPAGTAAVPLAAPEALRALTSGGPAGMAPAIAASPDAEEGERDG